MPIFPVHQQQACPRHSPVRRSHTHVSEYPPLHPRTRSAPLDHADLQRCPPHRTPTCCNTLRKNRVWYLFFSYGARGGGAIRGRHHPCAWRIWCMAFTAETRGSLAREGTPSQGGGRGEGAVEPNCGPPLALMSHSAYRLCEGERWERGRLSRGVEMA